MREKAEVVLDVAAWRGRIVAMGPSVDVPGRLEMVSAEGKAFQAEVGG